MAGIGSSSSSASQQYSSSVQPALRNGPVRRFSSQRWSAGQVGDAGATGARTPLRTDDDTARDDIAAYTAALLRATPATGTRLLHRGDNDVARAAAAVAHEVAPSFLDARLAAQQLHGTYFLPSADDREWRSRLKAGTEELLRQDLADVAEHTHSRPEDLLAVLRATAFALGAGLPWATVWPAAVRGLEPRCEAPDTCIRVVRDSHLTGYLTTAIEDGRTVYRPIHERVAEVLRTAPHPVALGRSGTGLTSVHLLEVAGPPRPFLRTTTTARSRQPPRGRHPTARPVPPPFTCGPESPAEPPSRCGSTTMTRSPPRPSPAAKPPWPPGQPQP